MSNASQSEARLEKHKVINDDQTTTSLYAHESMEF